MDKFERALNDLDFLTTKIEGTIKHRPEIDILRDLVERNKKKTVIVYNEEMHCPHCDMPICMNDERESDFGISYCKDCGQYLDWFEEERWKLCEGTE